MRGSRYSARLPEEVLVYSWTFYR